MKLINLTINLNESRIDELLPSHARGLRDIENKTGPGLKHFLSQHGFKELGRGLYASVWGSDDSSNVVKVTHGVGDSCWLAFAENVGRNKNKHYPRISKVKMYTDKITGKPNFYCFLERLIDINDIKLTDDDIELACFLGGNFGIMLMHPPRMAELIGGKLTPSIMKEVGQSYKDADTFLDAIEELRSLQPNGCSWDLHDGNIMWRKQTNTLVITDPFS